MICSKLNTAVLMGTIAILTAACSNDSPADAREKHDALERTKTGLQQAGQGLADLLSLEGDKFVDAASRRLADVETRLAELRQTIDAKSGEAAAATRQKLAELEKHRTQLAAELDEMRQASGRAWQDLKRGVADGLAEIQRGVDRAAGNDK